LAVEAVGRRRSRRQQAARRKALICVGRSRRPRRIIQLSARSGLDHQTLCGDAPLRARCTSLLSLNARRGNATRSLPWPGNPQSARWDQAHGAPALADSLMLFGRRHDDRIGNVCFPLRQSRAWLACYTALIAAARDSTLGIGQANGLGCLSETRTFADQADRLIYPFAARSAAPHRRLIFRKPRGVRFGMFPSGATCAFVGHFFDVRETPLCGDRMGSLHFCFYLTEKRKIFRNRAGQTNG
jgi:hypothetical protein